MAERSGFFPYVPGDADSEYDNVFLAKLIASFISNGTYAADLAVTAGENMQVIIPAGQAWINGYYYRNDGPLTLTLANADGVLHRKDTVVLRWDVNVRSITARVLQGAPASNPVAPAIVRTAEQYDLKLAEISIPAGTTEIVQALITDTRLNDAVCGISHAVIDHLDMTTFYNQIAADLALFKSVNEAGFTAWFQAIRGALGDDAAGNLQNEIDAILAAKGQPNGFASLDASGHIPKEQLNLNFSGKLIIHVVAEDGGSVAGTRVRIRNEQLGSNYVQSLDALGNTTFSLLDNHVYYVVLLDYPSSYFGAAATVAIAGGETQDLTLTLKTEPDIVGFKIDVATKEVTYTDGAESFEPMSMTDGALSAGSWEGHWAVNIKPCLLKSMVVQYYLAKTGVLLYDYEHQANGTASDIRSGDDGDVMNEVPREYYKFWSETTPDGHTYRHFQLAKEPQDDTWCCNAFLSNSGVVQDAVYLPAYKGTIYNGKLRSLCGVAPTVSQTISTFRTAANAGGAGYGIRDLSKDRFLAALYILLFRSLNGQADLGKGVTSASAAVASGLLNDKPLFWGDQTGTNGVKFAGIEHFWGNVYDFLDGIVQIDNVYHYKIYGPYNDGGDGYLSGPTIPSAGYIDDMNFSNGYGMVPSATVSAETDSGYHDYSYNGGSGTHIQYVGGGWSNGAYAGPFDWYGNAASGLSTGIGASLYATPQN